MAAPAVRLQRPQRLRAGPGDVQPGEQRGGLPQAVGEFELGLVQRGDVRGRPVVHGGAAPQHGGRPVPGGPVHRHLGDEADRRPDREHGLAGGERRRVERGRAGQPERVPGGRQRQPQALDAQDPEPAERPAEAVQVAVGVAGQPGDPVRFVVAEHGGDHVVRRGGPGQQGVAPCGEPCRPRLLERIVVGCGEHPASLRTARPSAWRRFASVPRCTPSPPHPTGGVRCPARTD
ncbi:hypothetical protein GCM10025734_61350 [Kitasatospora paranensis]